MKPGFTLMEILIVVLIVAILAAVAVPQYQKAVLKSRYSALMPIGKAMADSNEIYYMDKGEYAASPAQLDVAGQEEVYPDGTEITLNSDDNYSYVLVANASGVPNANYVVYQKHSTNFPDNIHCEALTGDTRAEELCQSFHGEYIGQNGSYTAYLLSGDGTGSFSKECEAALEATRECSCGAEERDYSCNTTTGEWSYGEWSGCPTKPATSQTCSGGKQVRTVSCGTNGWETGAWSACASQAAATAYEEIQKYDEFARQLREAQEAYYALHNQYTPSFSELGVEMPSECRATSTGRSTNDRHWLRCGNDIFIDNSGGQHDDPHGFLMVEYCPGHNNGYNDCVSNRTNISYYVYEHVKTNEMNPNVRNDYNNGKEIPCLPINSIGTEVCGTFY